MVTEWNVNGQLHAPAQSTAELSSFHSENHHVDWQYLVAEEPSTKECQHLQYVTLTYISMTAAKRCVSMGHITTNQPNSCGKILFHYGF